MFPQVEETAVQGVVGSIVWAFRRLKKPRCGEMSARGYKLHSVCPQLSFFMGRVKSVDSSSKRRTFVKASTPSIPIEFRSVESNMKIKIDNSFVSAKMKSPFAPKPPFPSLNQYFTPSILVRNTHLHQNLPSLPRPTV